MKPEEIMERINVVMAHAWMVRNFLKHADEVQEDEGMLDVHRTIFDFIRAAEPSYERKDAREYLHRVKGKLSKLRRAAEHLEREYRSVSTHTNFEMASRSLSGCVRHVEELLAQARNVSPEAQQGGDTPEPGAPAPGY
jgi:hypothetical protein